MIAVITADIIGSRSGRSDAWMPALKACLNQYGCEPQDWEIYRGDSFQLKVQAKDALIAALHLKASIKAIDKLDVRIAIGLGDEDYPSRKITESNGSAYMNSGDCFQELKKQTLAVRSAYSRFDELFNLMLELALLRIDEWTARVSLVIKYSIEKPEMNQTELAKLLNRSQSSISEALSRGGFDEIMKMNDFYVKRIQKHAHP